MKQITAILIAIIFNLIIGSILAFVLGYDPGTGAITGVAIGLLISLTPRVKGVARAGVLTEIWTGETVKSLRGLLEGSWLDGIPDQSSIVNNDTIHLVDVGIDPDVLVNNTTYPIPIQALDDKDIAIKLDKYQTKATPVTDDELYALSYDKMARVKESHANAIADAKFAKAAHALCAQKHTKTTPVLTSTGPADPTTGRKRMTVTDLVALKASMDALKVPTTGRRLVLCPDHVNDLLMTEQTFREMYNIDRNSGTIGRLYGFDIYTYGANPYYTAAGVKKDLNSKPEEGEFQCSFAFYLPRVFKATGSTKMYYSEAATDPENQRNLINFRHYFVVMPKKSDAGVVIISGKEASAGNEAPSGNEA
ncbi:MAG: hypothetical protein NC117_10015 [Pseudoflavonifractor sp.]|nr:hypothetical protein [Pseudoflavonifractor sp.]